MGTENTEITVTAILDDSSLDKGFKKIATQAEKLSKTQTKGEQQSTASQKQAARIADKTRDKSKQDRKVTQRTQDFEKRVKPNLNAQEARHQEKITRQKKEQERSVLNSTKSQLGLMQRLRTWQTSRNGSKAWSEGNAMWAPSNGGGQGGGGPVNKHILNTSHPNHPNNPNNQKKDNGGTFFKDVGNMAVGVAGALAGAGVALFTSQLHKAIGSYEQQGRAGARLEGMGSLAGLTSTDSVKRAQAMGYSLTESYGHAATIGRQTGRVGATTTAQEFSRIYGGSVEEVGGTMGQLTRGGSQFSQDGGGAGRRALSHLFRDAVSSGLDASRTGEHLEAVGSLAEAAGSRSARDVDFAQISGMLGMLGATGKSGFQGARGASFLSGIDQGVRSGGKDDSSMAIGLQAMGFGYGGANDVSYYEARKQLEQGITGQGGAGRLDSIMSTFQSATGGGEELYDSLSESGFFGDASRQQIEDFVKDYQAKHRSGKSTEQLISEFQSYDNIDQRIGEASQSTNLRVNRQDANLDNRSAAQGAQLYDSFASMQNLMNDIVDTAMPDVINALNDLAGVIRNTANGQGVQSSVEKSANEKNETDSIKIGEVFSAANSFTDTSMAIKAYSKVIDDVRSENEELGNNIPTSQYARQEASRIQTRNNAMLRVAEERLLTLDPTRASGRTTMTSQERHAEDDPNHPAAIAFRREQALVLPAVNVNVSTGTPADTRAQRPTNANTAPAFHGTP